MVDLMTYEGENLSGQPWDVYPRPQMRRECWRNLNGQWEFTAVGGAVVPPAAYDLTIRVPFCPESDLSGIGYKDFIPAVWYRRKINISEDRKKGRIFLHFGAVDYKATVYINGVLVGSHVGGYSSFCFEIGLPVLV